MSNKIELLNPALQAKANQLIQLCADNGITIKLSQTWRTKEEQNAIYAQGRTIPGMIVTKCVYPQSLHCWGMAFDIVVIKNGKATWDTAEYIKVGKLCQKANIGLEWGGSWITFRDYPHYQIKGAKWSVLQKQYGTPEKFQLSWTTQAVKVVVLGKVVQGLIINGHSYTPVAPFAEALGKPAVWDGVKKVVKIAPVNVAIPPATKGTVRVVTGNSIIPAKIIDGRAYALVTDLGKALGRSVVWDKVNHVVVVK